VKTVITYRFLLIAIARTCRCFASVQIYRARTRKIARQRLRQLESSVELFSDAIELLSGPLSKQDRAYLNRLGKTAFEEMAEESVWEGIAALGRAFDSSHPGESPRSDS
jgi:hypothetical protein